MAPPARAVAAPGRDRSRGSGEVERAAACGGMRRCVGCGRAGVPGRLPHGTPIRHGPSCKPANRDPVTPRDAREVRILPMQHAGPSHLVRATGRPKPHRRPDPEQHQLGDIRGGARTVSDDVVRVALVGDDDSEGCGPHARRHAPNGCRFALQGRARTEHSTANQPPGPPPVLSARAGEILVHP